MKKKKSKGASLVIVVIITSIILSLGIAMLSMSLMAYKARVSESKRLQNLYESDSGLDIVYNIIRKTSAAAIQKAGNDVKKMTDEEARNNLFKEKFLVYLASGITENKSLKWCIENWQYPEYKTEKLTEYIIIPEEEHQKVLALDSVAVDTAHQLDEKRLNVEAKTTFISTGKLENRKTIEAEFVIDAPNYNDVVVNTSKDIIINPVYDGKIITADGDMKCTGNLTIDGNVWVKGTAKSDKHLTDYSYDKYIGGITLDSGTYKFGDKSEIYTSNTLNIKNNVTATVSKKVYSSNTYLGDTTKGAESKNAKLVVENELITNNDLALNSNGGSAKIKYYYGINDKEVSKDTATKDLAARESSCIIVNNPGSSLEITDKAYIMGLAYIDLGSTKDGPKKYQTGESIAVKGNYAAYTDPSTNTNVTLKYYNPLQLIEKIEVENVVEDFTARNKIAHFISYFDTDKTGNTANTAAGIKLPNSVFSAGAIVKVDPNSKRSASKIAITDQTEVNSRRESYATKVLAMGYTGPNKTAEEIYTAGNVVRSVSTQINFDEIKDPDTDDGKVYENYGKVILNDDEDAEIVIHKNGKVNIGSSQEKDFGDVYMKGLIVTKGNVKIEAGVNFTGNIITLGNVNVIGDTETINLEYDGNVTQKIIASNREYFNKIFVLPSTVVANTDLVENQAGELKDYYEKDFIKKGTWKVVK